MGRCLIASMMGPEAGILLGRRWSSRARWRMAFVAGDEALG